MFSTLYVLDIYYHLGKWNDIIERALLSRLCIAYTTKAVERCNYEHPHTYVYVYTRIYRGNCS